MKTFRVLLRGENFLMESEGAVKCFGFYTTRIVESPNEDDAELAAVALIRTEKPLRDAVRNDQSDPPKLYAEEIEEIAPLQPGDSRPAGYTFYEEEPTGS